VVAWKIEQLELGRRLAPQNPTPGLRLATAYRKRPALSKHKQSSPSSIKSRPGNDDRLCTKIIDPFSV